MPRPSKLTAETSKTILDLISDGVHQEVAAKAAGISHRTLHIWLERGSSGLEKDEPYADFREAFEVADARCEAATVARIRKAAQEDWRAAAWYLSRRWPHRWSEAHVAPAADGKDDRQVSINIGPLATRAEAEAAPADAD